MSRVDQTNAEPDAVDGEARVRALVKWFNVSKGFGFVAPADGSPDAFLHISVLNRAGLHDLNEGAEVVCTVGPGVKGPQVLRIVDVRPSEAPPRPARHRPAAPAGPQEEVSGTVKWFKPDKGFGFVTADDGAKDVFVHKSVLRRCHLNDLAAGQRVLMQVQEAAKGREATRVTLL
ncbi:cold-shock protein [Azospirillum halopraeferens]|uniref:cold-shock protein n=1 Tax=Azospirillum halopraeferens TaxID=34010 RepID=UPI0003FCEB0D|nr:cold shock domain-containing protein [Azospirillum halopraeferens]